MSVREFVMPKVRQAIETTLDELEVKQHGR